MKLAVAFLYNNLLFYHSLEKNGQISIGSNKKDTIKIDDLKGNKIIMKWNQNGIYVSAKKSDLIEYEIKDSKIELNKHFILSKKNRIAIFVSKVSTDTSLVLPYNCVFSLGSNPENDIVISNNRVSKEHITFRNESGNLRVEDKNSKNGLFLNGKRISIAKLKSGDILNILTIRIIFKNNTLFFENTSGLINIKPITSYLRYQNIHENNTKQSFVVYQRSPRIQEKLPSEDIVLSPPPAKAQKYGKRGNFLPSLMGIGTIGLSSLLYGAASPALIAARAASVVSPIFGAASSSRNSKKNKKRAEEYEKLREEKYGEYIQSQKARIDSAAKLQRDIITSENPTPSECNDILFGLKRNLWERKPSDRDYLDVRIGMGYEKLCVDVKSRNDLGFQMEVDEVRELTEQLIEATRIVDNIPKRISLVKNNTIGIVGNREKAIRLLKNMIVEITTLHCFNEVKIVGLFDNNERNVWESLRWLPHVWDENNESRFLGFYDNDTDSRRMIHELCDYLKGVIDFRVANSRETYRNDIQVQNPFYLVLIGSKRIAERESLIESLLSNNPSVGFTTIFLFDDLFNLPHECRFIIDIDNGICGYLRDEVNEKFFFTEDYCESVKEDRFDAFARKMASIKLKGFAKEKELPNSVTFLQGYNCQDVDTLNVYQRWMNSKPHKTLAAPIGILKGDKIFNFDIHEDAHGPHGLVAGTTGFGKSELLISWILSMAVNYHPHDVAFVLIDYKGGGMSSELQELPHVIGEITNNDENIDRNLISLKSEINRREMIFRKSGAKDIYKYHELLKRGEADYPLPHLMIVCDEFKVLKEEQPDFVKELVKIAVVGRSLGLHLILATQKPGGVVDDQITSNSRFRMCLKVATSTDSREMLKRPDAASLKQKGKCFILVGEDDYFDLFQSFWSGAPYCDNSQIRDFSNETICEVLINGERINPKKTTKITSSIKEYQAIIRMVSEVAKDHGIEKLESPWKPELPSEISIFNLLNNYSSVIDKNDLAIPIGLYDNPSEQDQGIISINLIEEGHYGIYGAPATGKTNLIKTILTSIAMNYTPEEINLYCIDCGGWGLSVFSEMPHVGGVALDCEEEKIFKLQKMILDEIERRKKLFYQHTVSSFVAYKSSIDSTIPAIVLVVDNIIALFDLYPDIESLLIHVSRDGATYGIYLIYSSTSTTGVKYKVMQNIKGSIAFELSDKGDYSAVVGRIEGLPLPNHPGRGFVKSLPPTVFQAALYSEGSTDNHRNVSLKDMFSKMSMQWVGNVPNPIPVMPDTYYLDCLISNFHERTNIPIGIAYDSIMVEKVDLSDDYSLLVTGGKKSQQINELVCLANTIKQSFDNSVFYVFDNIETPLSCLTFTNHTICSDDCLVTEMLEEIVEQLNIRKRTQNAKRVESDYFDEKQFIQGYEQIVIVITDIINFVDEVTNKNKDSMERICRLAQNLGVIVVASGNAFEISKRNEYESLTRVIVSNQNGIVLSGTPAMYSFFQNNLKYSEKEIDVGDGNAYVFKSGTCIKVKLPKG